MSARQIYLCEKRKVEKGAGVGQVVGRMMGLMGDDGELKNTGGLRGGGEGRGRRGEEAGVDVWVWLHVW